MLFAVVWLWFTIFDSAGMEVAFFVTIGVWLVFIERFSKKCSLLCVFECVSSNFLIGGDSDKM